MLHRCSAVVLAVAVSSQGVFAEKNHQREMQHEIEDLQRNSEHEQKYMDDPEKVKQFFIEKEANVRAAYGCYTQALPPPTASVPEFESKLSPDMLKHYKSDVGSLQTDWQRDCFNSKKDSERDASEVYRDFQNKHKNLLEKYSRRASRVAASGTEVILAAVPEVSLASSRSVAVTQQQQSQLELEYKEEPQTFAAYDCYSTDGPIVLAAAPWVQQLTPTKQQNYHNDINSLHKNWQHECDVAAWNGAAQSKEVYRDFQHKYMQLLKKYKRTATESTSAGTIAQAELPSPTPSTDETISPGDSPASRERFVLTYMVVVFAAAAVIGAVVKTQMVCTLAKQRDSHPLGYEPLMI